MQTAFESTISNLNLVLDQLNAEEYSSTQIKEDFTLDNFWSKFGSCMLNVSAQATKLTLAFSQSPYPTDAEVKPLVTNIEMAVLALISIFYSMPLSQGRTLHKAVSKSVIGVVEALQSLTKSIQIKDSNNSSKQHLQSTGTVWEICDRVNSLPRDNTQAVLANIHESLGLITDAVDELEEAQKNENVEEVNEDGLADDFNDDAIWSDADHLVVKTCVGLVKTAKAAMKKVSKAVSTSGRCDTQDYATELDCFMNQIITVSPAVDEVVTSLYPPVRLDVVQSNCENLASVIRCFLDVARASHFTLDADSAWLDFLLKAVDHNIAKVRNLKDTSSSVSD